MGIIKRLAPEGYIRTGRYETSVDCLGPGTRSVLWLQGCNSHCEGCIAPDMQPLDGGRVIPAEALADMFIGCKNTSGITISGGEPFYQADRLWRIIERIKAARQDYSAVIYTGYRFGELTASEEYGVKKLLETADIIIDGRYAAALDDNKGLRGSSNQDIIYLTPLGESFRGFYEEMPDRKNSFHISGGRVSMTGIPSAASKALMAALRESFGKADKR